MKKIFLGVSLFLVGITVYALSNKFNFDSTQLTFASNSKIDTIVNNFDDDYKLSYAIADEDEEVKKEITELSKKTTSLLIGDIGSKEESNEHYYNRHKEYLKLAAYKYFSKDANSSTGLDESIENYKWVYASQLVIPQVFNLFNEAEIIYNSYGDIRVTLNGNLAISMVLLPNVKIKGNNSDNPGEYEYKVENLIIYYIFIKVDDEYRLCYLQGDYGEEVEEYFSELESNESSNSKALVASYETELSSLYNFDKLNAISDTEISSIYDKNINNLVYITSYYNNKLINSANGFFINDGIVITTWSFLEKALTSSQYIVLRDKDGNNYDIDGIITVNPDTDIVLIKLKDKVGHSVVLGDSTGMDTEDPAFIISSKSGMSYIVQKGIIISNNGYIQTSIPLSNIDEGSVLLNSKGQVVGINTSKSTGTDISIAINSKALEEIKSKFDKTDFVTIKTISFEELKENYYLKYDNESVINTIPKRVWKKYSQIGDIENNIKLELVKASYKDGIVSLRYKNNARDFITSSQLSASFRRQLIDDGYKEVLNSSTKYVYQNNKYQIIIMDEFDYLIVVMVKL